MSDRIPKLHFLIDYIQSRRAVGHTFTMLHGALNSPTALVLAVNGGEAQDLIRRGVERHRIVLLDSIPEALAGRNNPIAIDNHALIYLLHEVLEQNRMMRMELRKFPEPEFGETKKKKHRGRP